MNPLGFVDLIVLMFLAAIVLLVVVLERRITSVEKLNARLFETLEKMIGTYKEPGPELTSPTPLSGEARQAIRDQIDKESNDKPFGGYPTFTQLMQGMEGQTFHEDADRYAGEEIQRDANLQNAEEAATEEEHQAELARRKNMQQAAAKLAAEYHARTAPVER